MTSTVEQQSSICTAIVNINTIVSGDWRNPRLHGDTIICEGSKIALVGTSASDLVAKADVVIDADGMTAIPGLINSHVHITFIRLASGLLAISKATCMAA